MGPESLTCCVFRNRLTNALVCTGLDLTQGFWGSCATPILFTMIQQSMHMHHKIHLFKRMIILTEINIKYMKCDVCARGRVVL